MSVHKKLMAARVALQATPLKKSGQNKFAGYSYFELGDFLPFIQDIFHKIGLCGVVSYNNEYAQLCITDVEDGTVIVITSPMAEANLKGTHPIQNLGAVETYQRRYLWMTAMEIVEHDVLDASEPVKETKKVETLPRAEPKATGKAPTKIEGREGPWQIAVETSAESDLPKWISLVLDATRLALENAQTQKDVMDIFKVNRNLFDKLKAEAPDDHAALLADFTTKKNSFEGAK